MNTETNEEKPIIEATATVKEPNGAADQADAGPGPVDEDEAAIAEVEALLDQQTESELEGALREMFQVYLRTGNHEVRQLAQACARGFCALLGADIREFFPDAPPIRDNNPPVHGAPTYPGDANQQGWPAHQAHVASGGSPNGFVPTQPPVDPHGNPLPGHPGATGSPHLPAAPAAGGSVPTSGGDPRNPSGAEMRVVDGPGVHPVAYPPEPGAGAASAPGQYPRRRRNKR